MVVASWERRQLREAVRGELLQSLTRVCVHTFLCLLLTNIHYIRVSKHNPHPPREEGVGTRSAEIKYL